MEQSTNGYGSVGGQLTPIAVVLRGIELHPRGAEAEAFTCILDGYVIYEFAHNPSDGTSRDEAATGNVSEEAAAREYKDVHGCDASSMAPDAETTGHEPIPISAHYAHYSYREEAEVGDRTNVDIETDPKIGGGSDGDGDGIDGEVEDADDTLSNEHEDEDEVGQESVEEQSASSTAPEGLAADPYAASVAPHG